MQKGRVFKWQTFCAGSDVNSFAQYLRYKADGFDEPIQGRDSTVDPGGDDQDCFGEAIQTS